MCHYEREACSIGVGECVCIGKYVMKIYVSYKGEVKKTKNQKEEEEQEQIEAGRKARQNITHLFLIKITHTQGLYFNK